MASSITQDQRGDRLTHDVPREIRLAPSLVEPWDVDPIATIMFKV